ncbi:MAG: alcohol dehydrogenase catalytic domain-containing protein [Propionibacteriaceae bacterium]|nr:alcohol dehydrogenase catalytic domain-containing protein [Propionibacteriaceae bacterium]
MKITGAVLERVGTDAPYATSKPIVVTELELDPPGPTELLVRVEAAGICHSDLSVVNGARPRPVPMLLGHESAGIVVEAGEQTAVRPGQRVVMTFLPRCGECPSCLTDGRLPCEPGSKVNAAGTLMSGGIRLHRGDEPILHHLGVSGFATHTVVDERSVVVVPDEVPPHVAAVLGCAVLTGGGAVLNAGQPEDGDTVAVVGLGGVGMAALITAVALGRGPVIGIDALPDKLDRATSLGAQAVYTPEAALAQGFKAPVVIEAAGHPRALETAFAITSPGGRTVTVGLPHPDARSSFAPAVMTGEARTIIGSYLGSAVPTRDIPTYAQMWLDGKLPIEALISSHITLNQINEGMDALAEGRAMRQIIDLSNN